MKKLKKGQELILYSIVRQTRNTRIHLGSRKQTLIGSESCNRYAWINGCIFFQSGEFQEVKPVAKFIVRRLHNNDPITII